MLPILKNVRDTQDGPVLIHMVTQKGKGYAPAEAAADKYHGVNKFDVITGKQSKPLANAPSYTKIFGTSLIEEARHDDKIVAVTAAMPTGTGLDLFGEVFPKRTFDVGIAEQHAVTFAAGLASEGYKPFCAIYSTFLQRGYDQVVHDVSIQNLPVRFPIDRAGLVGADGPTHAGSFDTGFLAALPGFVVMAASDEAELRHMVRTAAEYDEGPISFRYPRGDGVGVELPERGSVLEIGKGRIVREGTKVALCHLVPACRNAWALLMNSPPLDFPQRLPMHVLPNRSIMISSVVWRVSMKCWSRLKRVLLVASPPMCCNSWRPMVCWTVASRCAY